MEQKLSPVTGILDEALVVLDYGPHEGKTVQQIASIDQGFYDELAKSKEAGNFMIRRQKDKTFRLYRTTLPLMDQ